MNPICTATTVSGRPCRGRASQWPRGIDGDPQLCGRHLPVELREIRDAGFAEEGRRHVERLATRDPDCWSWPADIGWAEVTEFYGGAVGDLRARFEAEEEHAVYMVLLAWQGDRCAVCSYRDPRLVRDHDHETGMVRGLLCRSCNGLEPHDVGLFQKYRSRPPAQILGLRLRYYDQRNGWSEPRPVIQRRLANHPAYALVAKLAARLSPEENTDEPQDR